MINDLDYERIKFPVSILTDLCVIKQKIKIFLQMLFTVF